MIEMEILRRAAQHALTAIASPDFDLNWGWNQSVVRKLDNAAE